MYIIIYYLFKNVSSLIQVDELEVLQAHTMTVSVDKAGRVFESHSSRGRDFVAARHPHIGYTFTNYMHGRIVFLLYEYLAIVHGYQSAWACKSSKSKQGNTSENGHVK